MNLAVALFERLAKRGGVPFAGWAVAVFLTVLIFHFYGEPLEREALLGMGFTYGVVGVAGSWTHSWWRRRRKPKARAKKRTTKPA
jgi:hypothetical protein